ncbi:hypothetical protein MmiAt1_10290 [Methanimicrococcus sp. At1]|uniref:DUF4325 domain-containing protein n=1 Tax=Methanimicrococcus hacksteinii TaxID=3028293 RepID=A0ABU3VRC0_9EURY|nr:DUF4325 domain-containing protein [Methanimicrococcus sp. At1]MDV0445450.1 hypothetical protein [Methanimicrococcus sp. At1]
MNVLNVREIIDTEFAVSFEDGQKVYSLIKNEINHNGKVILSFEGVSIVIPLFLNSVLRSIPIDFENSQISDLVIFEEMSENDRKIADIVIGEIYKYHRNPEAYTAAYKEMLES